MLELMDSIVLVLWLALPIAGYVLASRRPGHTRWHLVRGATIGGGLAGAISAAYVAAGVSGLSGALPFALLGLANGAAIGLLGVLAFAIGRWLRREP